METSCANFRDVADFVNLIAGIKLLPIKRLYRGGKIQHLTSLNAIDNPATIINLRKGKDPYFPHIQSVQKAMDNHLEVYNTLDKKVRRWLNEVMVIFQDKQLQYPVFIHCTAGKDRTGVVVAALLHLLDIPHNIIIEEYLLSDGEVNKHWIQQALTGITSTPNYFNRVDTQLIKNNIFSD